VNGNLYKLVSKQIGSNIQASVSQGIFLQKIVVFGTFLSINFVDKLIGEEGARLLRDERSGETLKGAKRQGAHRSPRGKRAPETEINLFPVVFY
jgi:hypothetical protein